MPFYGPIQLGGTVGASGANAFRSQLARRYPGMTGYTAYPGPGGSGTGAIGFTHDQSGLFADGSNIATALQGSPLPLVEGASGPTESVTGALADATSGRGNVTGVPVGSIGGSGWEGVNVSRLGGGDSSDLEQMPPIRDDTNLDRYIGVPPGAPGYRYNGQPIPPGGVINDQYIGVPPGTPGYRYNGQPLPPGGVYNDDPGGVINTGPSQSISTDASNGISMSPYSGGLGAMALGGNLGSLASPGPISNALGLSPTAVTLGLTALGAVPGVGPMATAANLANGIAATVTNNGIADSMNSSFASDMGNLGNAIGPNGMVNISGPADAPGPAPDGLAGLGESGAIGDAGGGAGPGPAGDSSGDAGTPGAGSAPGVGDGTAGDGGGGGGGAGGGSVICTAMHDLSLMDDKTYAADEVFGRRLDPIVYRGYVRWARPIARAMRRHPWLAHMLRPVVMAWAKEMAYQVGHREVGDPWGYMLMAVGLPLCRRLGREYRVAA